MALHADDEMDDDGLSILDVESAVLTGTIIERQRDRKTQESQYLVRGQTVDGAQILVAVTQFGRTGQWVVLTV